MTNIFDEEKYQVAADKCVAFIKRQLDVNNFRFQLSFGAEYGSWYSGDVLWGMVNGLSNAEDQFFQDTFLRTSITATTMSVRFPEVAMPLAA